MSRFAAITLVAASAALATGTALSGTAYGACVEPEPSTATSEVGVRIPGDSEPDTTTPATGCAAVDGSPGAVPGSTSPTGTSPTGGSADPSGTGSTPGRRGGAPRVPARAPALPASATQQSAPAGAPGAPVPPPSPSDGADRLELNPETVEAGGRMQAKATGYTVGEQVQLVIYSNPVIIGSYTADADGALSITFTVPVETLTGGHTAEATGWESHHVANGTFLVTTTVPDAAGAGPISWWLIGIVCVLVLALAIAFLTLSPIRRALAPTARTEASA